MPPAGDYKRRYDNDRGLNTGGMGAIAPYYLLSEHTLQTHVYPCIRRLVKGEKYTGFLYIGLMVSTPSSDSFTAPEWNVLEFNCRLGDPETQAVLSLYRNPTGIPPPVTSQPIPEPIQITPLSPPTSPQSHTTPTSPTSPSFRFFASSPNPYTPH